MTTLFDTARIPLWYVVFWIALVIAVRLWLVNPLIRALNAVARGQRSDSGACTSPAQSRSWAEPREPMRRTEP